MENDNIKRESRKIDNVLDWLKVEWPHEWEIEQQDPRIDTELTFSWLEENVTHIEACDNRLGSLDTAVRDQILVEATTRLFEDMINENGFNKAPLLDILKNVEER